MATRVETVAPVKMRIKRKSSSKPLAENLFGKRFSKLTIEDEYNYNLEYLISETKPTRWIDNLQRSANSPYADQAKHFQRWIPERESDYSPVRETTIDGCKPLAKHIENHQTKQNNDAESIYKYPKSKNLVIGRPPLNRSGAISMPVMCESSPIEERRRYKPKVFTRPDGSIHIERLQPPARAMASSHSSTDSTYPGLHIYVTESPPRPYYEVISPIEPPVKHAPRRTVACDPINVSYPSGALLKSERTFSPAPQGEREEGDSKGKDNPMRKSIEQIEPRSVASRVEAFMALLQPKEETRPQDNHYQNKSPIIIESRMKSPNEAKDRNRERLPSRLQRSATVNYGKSGCLSAPKVAEYCFTCCKRIYPVDRVSIEDRVYHKGCFRCATCQRIVLPGNFASLDGIILCKPHYIEQFRLSGKYELQPFSIKIPNFEHLDAPSPIFEA